MTDHLTTKLFCCCMLFLGSCSIGFSDGGYIELANEKKGVPKEYVPGLRGLPPGEIRAIHDAEGRTLLHIGMALGHQIRSFAVLAAGADVNAVDIRGRTPLHDLVDHTESLTSEYKLALVEMLALAGADINAVAADGMTPLAGAVQRRDFDFAEYLVWRGAEWAPRGVPVAKQPISLANQGQDPEILRLVSTVEAPNPAAGNGRPLLQRRKIADSLLAADLNGVIDAVNEGWNVNEQDKRGRSALFRAVEQKRPELVHLLLVVGADPNLADKGGRTPLMFALGETGIRSDRMIINLLTAGANPQATSTSGETPLIVAARAGHDWGILLLAGAGADPRAETPRGSLANYVSHGPTLGILRRFGVEQTAQPGSFETEIPAVQLIEAAKRGDVGEVKRCLDAGTPPDAILGRRDQRTALFWAANFKRFQVVDLLIARGANVNNQFKSSGGHLLHDLAARYDVDHENQVGRDAAEIIQFLLAKGARVDIAKADGTTPLMSAAQAGITGPNVQVLLNAGANINARNKKGLSVLGVAKKHGRWEMAAMLEKLGARD